MLKKRIIHWSDEFHCGNEEIDSYHRQILEDVARLYDMLTDSARFKHDIAELTRKIEKELFTHFEVEINFLKTATSSDWINHEKDHNHYKSRFEFYHANSMPIVIRAVLTGEIALDYMNYHFFNYDVNDLLKTNKENDE